MNLSNMKKMNDKPLRRVQGFKVDGASYMDNSNLDHSQNFAMIYKTKTSYDTQRWFDSFDGWYWRFLRISNNELQFRVTLLDFTQPTVAVSLTHNIEDVITIGCMVSDGTMSLLYDGTIYTYPTLIGTIGLGFGGRSSKYVLGATFNSFDTPPTYSNYSDYTCAEVLEIQDTLTDAQLLEFANLARFTDHSDYETFNKNAYYPLDYNTKDYSGNSNNGTVTGTEQYEIVERGIKSINGAEVLSKKGFNADGSTTVVAPITPSENTGTLLGWIHLKTGYTRNGFGYSELSLNTRQYVYYNYTTEKFVFALCDTIVEVAYPFKNLGNVHVGLNYSTNTFDCYINGVLVLGGTSYAPTTLNNLRLNYVSDSSNNGVSSEIKLFSTKLIASEIKEEMKGNVLPALGYWPLQEDTKDYSNNSNNGTVTGTEQYETIQNGLTDWKDPVLP